MQTNPIKNVSKDKKNKKKHKDQQPKPKPEPISNWEAEGGAILPEETPFVPRPALPGWNEDKHPSEKKENNEGDGQRRK